MILVLVCMSPLDCFWQQENRTLPENNLLLLQKKKENGLSGLNDILYSLNYTALQSQGHTEPKPQTLKLRLSLLDSSFVRDRITSFAAQLFSVVRNATLTKMSVITASMQSKQATPPGLKRRWEAARGEWIKIKFIDLWFTRSHPSAGGLGF